MRNDKDKKKDTGNDQPANQPIREQEPSIHFDRVTETYGNEETLEDEAAAEQQRKEALTERD